MNKLLIQHSQYPIVSNQTVASAVAFPIDSQEDFAAFGDGLQESEAYNRLVSFGILLIIYYNRSIGCRLSKQIRSRIFSNPP